MSNHQGWLGVDLDGTLAEYTGWKGASHIGAPIKPMQIRVLRWLAAGFVSHYKFDTSEQI